MGGALRIYVITDEGAFRRFPFLSFYRVIYERARVPFDALVGKRVRYAKLHVRCKQRKAVAVVWAYFGYLTFDNDGMFDASEWTDLPPPTVGTLTLPNIRDASLPSDPIVCHAERRRAHGYEWEPTAELRRALIARIVRRPQPRGQG